MRAWLITVGEPLPKLSGDSRPWRTGMLAQELARRGHEVTWWTSRVDHFNKRHFEWRERDFPVQPGLTIRFLDGRVYRRNIGVARLVNHWEVARDFDRLVASAPRPDVILCSFPTIELSAGAIRYGAATSTPVVLDVRDLWPDIFLDAVPRALRLLPRVLLDGYFRSTRESFRRADAVVAVSRGYLDWGLARAGRPGRDDDHVFPLAYSLPAPTPEARAQGRELMQTFGVGQQHVACLFAGTLGRTYDLGPVFEAARQLGADSPFRFVICGDGERAPEWRERARGLNQVHFTGWLEQGAMRSALMGADLGLAAYAAGAPQGLPNKVIEYLAAGLPLLSSLEGETRDLLSARHCGSTYRAGDAAGLLAALRPLASAEARQACSREARRVFEAEFQAEAVYASFAEFLERLARRSAPRAAA